MRHISHFVKKYPLSILCILLVWILSLSPMFPETPFQQVYLIDKYTHLIMYGGTCSVIWWEYLRSHRIPDGEKLLFYAVLCPIVMSGVLELLQEYCTADRSGDWLDLLANSIGVGIGAAIGMLMYGLWFKRR